MKQILFVYRNGHIAFWKVTSRGLVRSGIHGERWTDYTPDYWTSWADATQITDALDAILLVESSAKIDVLPGWLEEPDSEPSAWTLDQLADLTEDAEFEESGIELVQGKIRHQLSKGDPRVAYNLVASLKFKLPKPETDKAEASKKVASKKPSAPKSKTASDLVGDSYNDPAALKHSVGDELDGVVEKILTTLKRNYVRVEGLKEQVCFKTARANDFVAGDEVKLKVTKVDGASKVVLFVISKT